MQRIRVKVIGQAREAEAAVKVAVQGKEVEIAAEAKVIVDAEDLDLAAEIEDVEGVVPGIEEEAVHVTDVEVALARDAAAGVREKAGVHAPLHLRNPVLQVPQIVMLEQCSVCSWDSELNRKIWRNFFRLLAK